MQDIRTRVRRGVNWNVAGSGFSNTHSITDRSRPLPLPLIGTKSEIAHQLRERRARFRFSYVTMHEPYPAGLAPVVAELG